MYKIRSLFAIILALVLLCTGAIAVSASTVTPEGKTQSVSEAAQDAPAQQTPGQEVPTPEAPAQEAPAQEELPQVVDITPQDDPDEDAVQEQAETETPRKKSNNTPYFVGAVIAVIVFIGVALYCKFNGNGSVR